MFYDIFVIFFVIWWTWWSFSPVSQLERDAMQLSVHFFPAEIATSQLRLDDQVDIDEIRSNLHHILSPHGVVS